MRNCRRILPLSLWTICATEGQPAPELFVKDGLHLNNVEYCLWTSMVARVLKNLSSKSSTGKATSRK